MKRDILSSLASRVGVYVALAVTLAALPACSSTDGGGDSDSGPAPTWTTIYGTLFTSCPGCHSSGLAAFSGNLDMSSQSTAYNMLVGQTAEGTACGPDAGHGAFTRVVAGNANLSLLYSKLSSATPVCGSQMPLGVTPFTTAQVAEVAAWINAGALNN